MKWMRRLFVFCSVLSLVLGLATASLWVRSYWRADIYDAVSLHGPGASKSIRTTVGTERGVLRVQVTCWPWQLTRHTRSTSAARAKTTM